MKLADLSDLGSAARPAELAELATLYAALDRNGGGLNPVAPGLAVAAPERPVGFDDATTDLTRMGIGTAWLATPELPAGAYLLGGHLHGWCVPGVPDLPRIVSLLHRERLRAWAAVCGPTPTLTTHHRPGSDSIGVAQFRTDREVVAKVGGWEQLRLESGFTGGVNRSLAEAGLPPLYPEQFAVCAEGAQGVTLMEAAEPARLTAEIFDDPACTQLGSESSAALEIYLEPLSVWYRRTWRWQVPTAADYLYRERFHVLAAHPAVAGAFRAVAGDRRLAELFAVPVRLAAGVSVPGLTEATAWLDRAVPALLPAGGSSVHGDLYFSNLLRRGDGTPVLIDPRMVWEERDRPDVGFGDPTFDLATVLHGALPMAAVLAAPSGKELFAGPIDLAERLTPAGLDLTGLRLPTTFSAQLARLEARLLAVLPHPEPAAVQRARLYLGAASSLLGWLKYAKVLDTCESWLATYAYTVWYVQQARTVLARPDHRQPADHERSPR